MGKLRVFESISIDGYFTDDDDDVSWAHVGRDDPEFGGWVGQNAGSGGALLFGRKTYEMMEAYWPTAEAARQMPEVAEGMNAAKKFLASRTLEPTWRNTERLDGQLVDAVRRIKATEDLGITVLGSGSIVAQLSEAGLVDEYQFVLIPVVLGSGRSLFTKGQAMRLTNQRAFACGNVVLTYAP
jgi:dihydrofolate reductase